MVPRALRRLLATVALAAVLALTAGCGNHPLDDSMTPPQQHQLDRMMTAAFTLYGSVSAGIGQITPASANFAAACQAADTTQPVLAAIARSCPATIKSLKLASLLSSRCFDFAGPCARTALRIGASVRLLQHSEQAIAATVAIRVHNQQ